MKFRFLILQVMITFGLLSCKGSKGDPGPQGTSNSVTGNIVTDSTYWTGNSITGWSSVPVEFLKSQNSPVDTNSSFNVYFINQKFNLSNQTSTILGFAENPLPYVDQQSGIKYSYSVIYNYTNTSGFQVSLSLLVTGSAKNPGSLEYKYVIVTESQ